MATSSPASKIVIVVVCVSVGGLLLFSFMTMALCCFIKCRKKKEALKKREELDIKDHVRIQEAVIPGPHGNQIVLLKADEDVQIHKEVDMSKLDLQNKASKFGEYGDHYLVHGIGASSSGNNQ